MRNILLAEDDPHTIRLLTMWLTRYGYNVIESRNGREALEILEREPVALLITDVNMPHINGMQLVRSVREELKLDLPVIMFSSRCDQASIAETLEGFDVRLYAKPFVPSRLLNLIERILQPVASGN